MAGVPFDREARDTWYESPAYQAAALQRRAGSGFPGVLSLKVVRPLLHNLLEYALKGSQGNKAIAFGRWSCAGSALGPPRRPRQAVIGPHASARARRPLMTARSHESRG